VLVNSPAFSSTITVSMVSPVAMTTKRCEKKKSVRSRQANEKARKPKAREREIDLGARCPQGRSGIQDKAKPRNEERLIIGDEADGLTSFLHTQKESATRLGNTTGTYAFH
jgi:hypothetical protein